MSRPDLPNRALLAIAAGLLVALLGYFAAILPGLPEAWRRPGSPPLYLAGVVGAAFLSAGWAFAIAKRIDNVRSPPAWFVLHVLASCAGGMLIAIHSAGFLRRPPALLLLVLLALGISGLWGRTREARHMASTFATKQRGFGPAGDELRNRLRTIIARKREVLARLNPAAQEGLFSLTPRHWLARPVLALGYARLVHEEWHLMGTRKSVGVMQSWWRPLHIALACLLLAGLLIHVVTVTFFAGYVADYGEIHWWHLMAW